MIENEQDLNQFSKMDDNDNIIDVSVQKAIRYNHVDSHLRPPLSKQYTYIFKLTFILYTNN